VVEKRWSEERKKEILNSRIESARLLINKLKTANLHPKTFVSASAVGYYGNTGGALVDENAPAGNDFLADVCQAWEASVQPAKELGTRLVINRIGIVLSSKGGALPQTAKPIQFGIGASLGDGKQFVPWVHIDDLCNLFLYAIQNEKMEGVYNATAPTPVTNKELTDSIAEALGKKTISAPAPAFVLRMAMGEMADAVLGGQRTSSMKAQDAGFSFKYPLLVPALREVYARKV
jgi:uncharacterized protein (TIGR01777 family)